MIDYKINKNEPLGFCLSLITAAMWGILPIALKELLAGMDAVTIVWYRFLLAALFVLGWLYFRGQLPSPAGVSKLTRGIIIIAAAGLCANYVLFSYSLNYVNAETSEAVIQLTTLFLILGGVLPVCSVAASLAKSCLTNSFDDRPTSSPLKPKYQILGLDVT